MRPRRVVAPVPQSTTGDLTDRSTIWLTDERFKPQRAGVRGILTRRFAGSARIRVNVDMGPAEVRRYCEVDPAAQPLLKAAAQRLQLSARAFHRVLKLARTIADLAGDPTIAAPHIAEALQYRPRVDVG
jgi:predicted ATPase with chaperone activity